MQVLRAILLAKKGPQYSSCFFLERLEVFPYALSEVLCHKGFLFCPRCAIFAAPHTLLIRVRAS